MLARLLHASRCTADRPPPSPSSAPLILAPPMAPLGPLEPPPLLRMPPPWLPGACSCAVTRARAERLGPAISVASAARWYLGTCARAFGGNARQVEILQGVTCVEEKARQAEVLRGSRRYCSGMSGSNEKLTRRRPRRGRRAARRGRGRRRRRGSTWHPGGCAPLPAPSTLAPCTRSAHAHTEGKDKVKSRSSNKARGARTATSRFGAANGPQGMKSSSTSVMLGHRLWSCGAPSLPWKWQSARQNNASPSPRSTAACVRSR